MSETKIDVLKIATKQSEANVVQLQEILDLIHAQGNTFWASADEFLAEGYDSSVFFIEVCNGGYDLNGDIHGDEGSHTILPFVEWHKLVLEFLSGRTAPVATIENAAFQTANLSIEQIQVLVDIAAQHGVHLWDNAEDYKSWTYGDQHVGYFAERCGIDGCDAGLDSSQVLVSYDEFLELYKAHYGEVIKSIDEMPKRNPQPRFRKRRRKKPTTLKTFVRVLYVDQKTYTFKNVRSVQIIDNKVFIQHERVITEGIKENAEVEIDGDLVMAVVIHEAGNRSNFFRNIDGTWDFQNEDGTVINNGQQLGRIFKK